MNQVPEQKKESATKTLAIVGFVALILFIVWLAVQIVSVIPSAFSSLASIADSVYNPQSNQEIVIQTNSSVVNAGESFTINWTQMRGNGTYSFSYDCTDGVAVDIRQGSGAITSVDCDESFELNSGIPSLDMRITSEKQRFSDIRYTITYSNEALENDIVAHAIITIVNASIPAGTVAGEDTTVEEDEEETVVDEEESTPTPTTGVTAGEPTVIEEVIYKIPVSDPNGKIDLRVTHLGVGTIRNGIFVPTAEIDTDTKGAIQFEIKNIGTKTADNWSYVVNLPSDIEYDAGSQKALKPNEKAVITVGFEGIARTGIEKFGAEVTAQGDVNKANNEYVWSVKVVD